MPSIVLGLGQSPAKEHRADLACHLPQLAGQSEPYRVTGKAWNNEIELALVQGRLSLQYTPKSRAQNTWHHGT